MKKSYRFCFRLKKKIKAIRGQNRVIKFPAVKVLSFNVSVKPPHRKGIAIQTDKINCPFITPQ